MKMCNKVLAVILTLVMLLTAVPLAAFADTPSAGGGASGAGGAAGGVTALPTTPITLAIPLGDGSDGTIKVEIDAKEIVAALKTDRSLDALIDLLKDAISRTETDVVTVSDLMGLVPVDAIVTALLGENNANAPALIEQFGGLDELMKMLDRDELILSADKKALTDFILSLEDPFTLVYIDEILKLDINWDLQTAYGYANRTELENRIKALTYDELLALVGGVPANLKKIVYYDDLLDALLAADKIDLKSAVDFKRLEQNEVIKKAVIEAVKNDYKAILEPSGVQKIEEDLFAHANEYFAKPGHELKLSDLKEGVVTDLIRQLAGDKMVDYIDVDAVLNHAELKQDAEAELNKMLASEAYDEYDERLQLLTPEAQAALAADRNMTITVDHLLDTVVADIVEAVFLAHANETEDYFAPFVYGDNFVNDHENDIIDLFKSDAKKYIENDQATAYVKEEKIDAVIADYASGLSFEFFDVDADFKTEGLKNVVLDAADANGIEILDYLVDGYNPFEVEGVASIIMANINWTAVDDPAVINREAMLKALLGADGSIFDLIPEDKLQAYLEETGALDIVFSKISKGEVVLEKIVNVEKLLNSIPSNKYGELLNLFDRSVLIEQLKPNVKTLVKKLNKEQLKAVMTPVISSMLQNIDLISLDGYNIAVENEKGMLTFDANALVQFLLTKVPSLDDLSEKDAPILSFNIYVAYKTVDGVASEKDINFELTFGGDLAVLKDYINKLRQYIKVDKVGNQLYVEILVPYKVTQAYAKLLSTDQGAALRNEILAMAGMTGGDMTAALEKLTLEQIITLLQKVDFAAIYDRMMALSQVEAVLERVCAKTGLSITVDDIDDLDAVIDRVVAGDPTFDAVCEAIEARTGRDIVAYLEKLTTFADKNQTIQNYLDKLADAPYIGKYVSKFIDNNTLTEILNNYKDVEPIEAVSSYLAAKVGKDVKDIVLAYDVDEIYQAALVKVAEYEDQFNRGKNFVLNVLDPNHTPTNKWEALIKKVVPASVLQRLLVTSLSDFYRGNGTFSASVENIHIDLAAWAEKAFEEINDRVNIDNKYVNMIMDAIPERTLDIGLHVKVTFQGISEVTYHDANGNELALVYLPNGSDPAKFGNAPVIAGKNFLYWVDASGKQVTKITGDIDLYARYDTDVFYTVTVQDKNGKAYGAYLVMEGETLAEAIARMNGYEYPVLPDAFAMGYENVNGNYALFWLINDGTTEYANIYDTAVYADTVYTFDYKFIDGSHYFAEANGKDIIVTNDNGNWRVQILGHADFHLKIYLASFTEFVNAKSLTVESTEIKMALSRAMIEQIAGAAKADTVVDLTADVAQSFAFPANDLYGAFTSDAGYDFNLKVDGEGIGAFVENGMTLTLAAPNAVETSGKRKTSVYVLNNGALEPVACTVVTGATNTVTFAAPHFSKYIAINEVYFTSAFAEAQTRAGINGGTALDGQWIPAGAPVQIKPAISGDAYGKLIASIDFVNASGESVLNVARIGDTVAMPDGEVTLKVVVTDITTFVFYVIGDQIYTAAEVADHLDEIVVPVGYELETDANGIVWTGKTDEVATVYLYPSFKLINYTLNFVDITGAAVATGSFTVETFGELLIPAVPTVDGQTGTWNLPADVNAVIALMDENNALTVEPDYTGKLYTVTTPDGVENVACGTEYTINIQAPIGYEINAIKAINLNTNAEVTITNGKFIMPAGDVEIVLEKTPLDITYTVTDITDNKQSVFTQPYGSEVTFTLTVPKTHVLVGAPNAGKLVSFKANTDGSKTLVYSLTVGEQTKIIYKTLPLTAANVAFANGMVTGENEPVSLFKRLNFTGFSSPADLKFDGVVNYQFATYERVTDPVDLLWLWILLAVILLILIIAVVYMMVIRGMLKANFFTNIVVAIVSLFFKLCLAISGLVLMITQGTTKKDEVDFNAYGVNNPEKAPEEAAEETAEEATEEITEEAPAEEATEETAEEATEADADEKEDK